MSALPKEVTQSAKKGMIAGSDLRRRGWTPTLVKQLLPAHDSTADNPHNKRSPAMRLYDVKRVLAAERTDAFKTAQSSVVERRLQAQRLAEQKSRELLHRAVVLPIAVPQWDLGELMVAAIAHYESIAPEFRPVSIRKGLRQDPAFLARVTLTYLRSWMERTDEHFLSDRSNPSYDRAMRVLEMRKQRLIARAYPDLVAVLGGRACDVLNFDTGALTA